MSANGPAPLTRTADGVGAAATRGINLRRLARYAERSVIRSPCDQIASSCHAAGCVFQPRTPAVPQDYATTRYRR
jgi:hypothetical protein